MKLWVELMNMNKHGLKRERECVCVYVGKKGQFYIHTHTYTYMYVYIHTYIYTFIYGYSYICGYFYENHIVLCCTGICSEPFLEYKLQGKTFSLFPKTKTYTMQSLYIYRIKNHFPPKLTCKALNALE